MAGTTDGKLYQIFRVAGEKRFSSRAELARDVASRLFDEFSYEEEGEKKYMTAKAIEDYVAFGTMIGLLDGDLAPYVLVEQVTKKGFNEALGEKVENFAEAYGFSATKIRGAMRDLLARSPVELPSPRGVFHLLKPTTTYHMFYKAVTVRAFHERSKVFVQSRQIFVSDEILRIKND